MVALLLPPRKLCVRYFIGAAYDNLTAARVKTELFPTRLPIKNSAVEKWRRNMRHYFLTTKRQSAFGTWT